MVSKKVVLTGCFSVGKSSLFNRFIEDKFSDTYLTTVGVRVNKKAVRVNSIDVNLMVWDIAGEVTQDKVPVSYILGTSCIIYVFDLTRSETFANIARDIEYLNHKLPNVPIKLVGNKKDLLSQDELLAIWENSPAPISIFTSAKTGENVAELFTSIAEELV